MSEIKELRTAYYRVPLDEVLADAVHGDHTHFELITVDIATAGGITGTGYTYTGGFGGRAIFQVVEYDLKPFLIGKDADCIETLWHGMNWRIHYVGRGGVAGFAVSAVDIALWDLRGKKSGLPLRILAGGRGETAKAYGGGIDLHYDIAGLKANVGKYLARGFPAVKIKVGKPKLEDDLARIRAIRDLLGSGRILMVDANMKWTAETAVKAARAMRDYDVFWLEEPTVPDDFPSYDRIRKEGGIPLAMGENLHTMFEFREAVTIGKIDFPQPDASNVGGVTGWLKVANLAQFYNLPVSSHGMQELHVSLLAGVPNAGYLEVHSFPLDRYTTRPLVLNSEGSAVAPNVPGTGVDFKRDMLEPYRVKL